MEEAFSYPLYESPHVNAKYAQNWRHHKKLVENADVYDLYEFCFLVLEIQILKRKENSLDFVSIDVVMPEKPKKCIILNPE